MGVQLKGIRVNVQIQLASAFREQAEAILSVADLVEMGPVCFAANGKLYRVAPDQGFGQPGYISVIDVGTGLYTDLPKSTPAAVAKVVHILATV